MYLGGFHGTSGKNVTWTGTILTMGAVFAFMTFDMVYNQPPPPEGLEDVKPFYGKDPTPRVEAEPIPDPTDVHVGGAYYPEDHPEYQPPEHWDPMWLAIGGGGVLAALAGGAAFVALGFFTGSGRTRRDEEAPIDGQGV